MNRLFTTFIGLHLVCFSSIAQYNANNGSVNVTISEPYPVIDGFTHVISKNDDDDLKTLTLSNSGQVVIRSFDKETFSLKSSIESEKVFDRSGFLITLSGDGETYLRYALSGKLSGGGNKKITLNFIDAQPSKIEVVEKYSFEMNMYNDFKWKISDDKKLMYLWYTKTQEDKEILVSMVFDWKMTELWRREIDFGNAKGIRDVFATISDDQKIDQVFNIVLDYTKPELNKLVYLSLDQNDQSLVLLQSSTGDNKYKVALDHLNSEEGIKMIGFYKTTDEYDGKAGVFTMDLDESGEVVNETSFLLPEDKLNLFTGTGEAPNKRATIERVLGIIESRVEENGNITIIGKENIYTHYNTSGELRDATGNFVVVQLKQDGSLNWIKVLPRHTFSGVSYNYEFFDNMLRLSFLDDLSNLKLLEDKMPAVTGFNGYLTTYDIDLNDGEAAKRSLVNVEEINGMALYQFDFQRVKTISDDLLIIEFYVKKKQNVWVKIELN